MARAVQQRERAEALLGERGMARLVELRAAGVTAATIGRMERDGEVLRLTRGVYQLADAPLHAQHSLAQIAKRVPKGVVCLVSALAFHGITDQRPARIWVAIGAKDGAPRGVQPPIRIVALHTGARPAIASRSMLRSDGTCANDSTRPP